MNNSSILLLTKDAFCKAYLPCYGHEYWKGKMPNLDELVEKGTKFNNFFTAAPSSNMSYLSMFTMKYPYMLPIKDYRPLPLDFKVESFFDLMKQEGYENHILWDEAWGRIDLSYGRCYGDDTTFHNMPNFRQPVGCKYPHGKLSYSEDKAQEGLAELDKELSKIFDGEKRVFMWCHLPHVLKGCTTYGSDMALFDRYIAVFRKYFSDNNIFISADHGNMNGLKGKLCYGFDVYEPAINIPLITPRLEGLAECDTPVCNIDFHTLISDRKIPRRDVIYSDSTYYGQPNRKLAVIKGKYRYIYNKKTGVEELYDVNWDPNQNYNLMKDNYDDPDRLIESPAIDYYFYPEWDKLPEVRDSLRAEKDKIWRTEDKWYAYYRKVRHGLLPVYRVYTIFRGLFSKKK